MNDMSDRKGTVYKQDKNGCCHDDQDFWQSECNDVYLTKKFCDSLEANEQRNKMIDKTCYLCNAMIVEPPSVAGFGKNDHLV